MPLANAAKRAGRRISLPITVLPSVGVCDAQRGKVAARDVARSARPRRRARGRCRRARSACRDGPRRRDVVAARGDDEAGNVVGQGRVAGSGGCGWRNGHGSVVLCLKLCCGSGRVGGAAWFLRPDASRAHQRGRPAPARRWWRQPLPTMSNAVPCAGVVNTVERPPVTVTPRLKPLSLVAICPWS